jgi:hypothetical protein
VRKLIVACAQASTITAASHERRQHRAAVASLLGFRTLLSADAATIAAANKGTLIV